MSAGVLILAPGSPGAGARLHRTSWMPQGEPKAVVVLAHGYAEHAGRYEHVAARLTAAGYAVHALDHWGHGKSDGEPGYVPAFGAYTDGLDTLLHAVDAEHPRLQRFLIGHSMGGLVSVLHLLERQGQYAGAVLSGPAIVPAEAPSRLMMWISRILSRLAPRLGVLQLDAAAISRDPAVVAAYLADPLVYTGKIGARLGGEMFLAMERARAGAVRLKLPLLLLHGADDRLTAPAGSQFLEQHVSSSDRTLRLYPGLYHEIFNEPERERVLDDVVAWLDSHCTRGTLQ